MKCRILLQSSVAPLYNFFYIVILLFLLIACTGGETRPSQASSAGSGKSVSPNAGAGAEREIQKQVFPGPAWQALALLETGDNPLWFELGSGGPLLIESPGAASLAPYAPWPHARFILGMMVWKGFLVMAVNRDGFLVLGPDLNGASAGLDSGRVVLYRSASGAYWDPYTAESFFLWQDKPAVLIYRNDFFSEHEAPSPEPQVFVLDTASAVPLGAAVPALQKFPPGDAWEAELVRKGPDGFWYYRVKEKGKSSGETAYFRTPDLGKEGVKISAGEWRNSDLPEKDENTPRFLAAMFDRIIVDYAPGEVFIARTVSPDFEGQRLFRAGGADNPALLYCYYREAQEPFALALLPDGRGFFSDGTAVGSFSLPALPDEFVYTGAAVLGSVLVVSWEEQQEAGIGAAGFMVLKIAW